MRRPFDEEETPDRSYRRPKEGILSQYESANVDSKNSFDTPHPDYSSLKLQTPIGQSYCTSYVDMKDPETQANQSKPENFNETFSSKNPLTLKKDPLQKFYNSSLYSSNNPFRRIEFNEDEDKNAQNPDPRERLYSSEQPAKNSSTLSYSKYTTPPSANLSKTLKNLLKNYRDIEEKTILLALRPDFSVHDLYNMILPEHKSKISYSAWDTFLTNLSLLDSEEEHQILFKSVDSNMDNFISFDEFVEALGPFSKQFKQSLVDKGEHGIKNFSDYSRLTQKCLKELLRCLVDSEKDLDDQRVPNIIEELKPVLFDRSGNGKKLTEMLASKGIAASQRETVGILKQIKRL
jgi:Ca2+-binding EF-hand superfamily protein